MKDYKELLKALRSCQHIASNCIDCPLSNTKHYNPKTHECEVHLHNKAADAIKQLVRERDVAVDDMDTIVKTPAPLCVVCNEAHCEACRTSEYNSGFEWRGVQK